MYSNDSLRFLINGHYSSPLWLTQGVKQGKNNLCCSYILYLDHIFVAGCNLSPLLFCLFLNNLGLELNSSGLGIDLGNTNISSIFFADDMVLVGKSRNDLEALMNITRTYFKNHRLVISETKSKIMSHDSSTGNTNFQGSQLSVLTLEQVLSFKYLGIPLNSSPYCLFKNFNEQVKKKAHSYLSSVLSLVRTGPDRSELAYILWTRCALPSILYGCEIIPLDQGTIAEVAKCQSAVGKFILQIPRSSSNSCSSIDAGLKPVWAVIAEKFLHFSQSTMSKPSESWTKMAMNENLSLGVQSPYTRCLLKWREATNCFGLQPKKKISICVHRAAVASVLDEQRATCVSTFAMNGPQPPSSQRWFKPKKWVNDSGCSKIIAQFRACNSGLGNRGPTTDGKFYKLCPLCSKAGETAINNEVQSMGKGKFQLLSFSRLG